MFTFRRFTLRRIAVLASVCLFSLSTTACLRQSRAERNRAEADRAEAQADLARAQADAVRRGEPAPQGEYVEVETEPQPPPAVVEVAPPQPSSVHVWIAGCHEWRHGAWAWVPGRCVVPPHSGVVWTRGHWARNHHGYVWVGGYWR
jgi:hypothetical protein